MSEKAKTISGFNSIIFCILADLKLEILGFCFLTIFGLTAYPVTPTILSSSPHKYNNSTVSSVKQTILWGGKLFTIFL